ncbi:MAG: DUF58 domain-containing protein, partial [Armatimonadota bacterium]|nr:DUF58 domain-containing protein [Armatimonadota bacterium]
MARVKLSAVFISSLFIFMVAAVLNVWQLFFMSATLGMLPIVSYLLGRSAARGLRCVRECPEYVSEGELISILLWFEGGQKIVGPVEVDDSLPQWFELVSEEQTVDWDSGALIISYTAMPKKRGKYKIGPTTVRMTDPLGFLRFKGYYPTFSEVTVYPVPLHILELNAKLGGEIGEQQFEGSGAKGSGVDFHGVRDFNAGDELRRVHWKSTARHGKLNVIEFEHTLGNNALIAIDLERGTEIGNPPFTSTEYIAKLAAGIAEQAIMHGSSVRLMYPGVVGSAASPGVGLGQFYAILEALAEMEADKHCSLCETILKEEDSIERNTVVICISPRIEETMAECVE